MPRATILRSDAHGRQEAPSRRSRLGWERSWPAAGSPTRPTRGGQGDYWSGCADAGPACPARDPRSIVLDTISCDQGDRDGMGRSRTARVEDGWQRLMRLHPGVGAVHACTTSAAPHERAPAPGLGGLMGNFGASPDDLWNSMMLTPVAVLRRAIEGQRPGGRVRNRATEKIGLPGETAGLSVGDLCGGGVRPFTGLRRHRVGACSEARSSVSSASERVASRSNSSMRWIGHSLFRRGAIPVAWLRQRSAAAGAPRWANAMARRPRAARPGRGSSLEPDRR